MELARTSAVVSALTNKPGSEAMVGIYTFVGEAPYFPTSTTSPTINCDAIRNRKKPDRTNRTVPLVTATIVATNEVLTPATSKNSLRLAYYIKTQEFAFVFPLHPRTTKFKISCPAARVKTHRVDCQLTITVPWELCTFTIAGPKISDHYRAPTNSPGEDFGEDFAPGWINTSGNLVLLCDVQGNSTEDADSGARLAHQFANHVHGLSPALPTATDAHLSARPASRRTAPRRHAASPRPLLPLRDGALCTHVFADHIPSLSPALPTASDACPSARPPPRPTTPRRHATPQPLLDGALVAHHSANHARSLSPAPPTAADAHLSAGPLSRRTTLGGCAYPRPLLDRARFAHQFSAHVHGLSPALPTATDPGPSARLFRSTAPRSRASPQQLLP